MLLDGPYGPRIAEFVSDQTRHLTVCSREPLSATHRLINLLTAVCAAIMVAEGIQIGDESSKRRFGVMHFGVEKF